MTNLTRWDPFSELTTLRRDFDRLLNDTFQHSSQKTGGWTRPLMDVYQTEDEVVVEAAIPGITPEDVKISITGDALSIHAEKKEQKEEKDANYLLREQSFRSFERMVTLPVAVQADKAVAEVKDGMLHLSIPKAEEAKAKSITIKAK